VSILAARSVHFVGVGGAGMSPLAELLALEGRAVSGSDVVESEATEHLRSCGVVIHLGHDARHVRGPDAVVFSAAVRSDNPEIEAARRAGIPLVRRASLLGALVRGRPSIAVSGAHGKTTTTAMIGAILAGAGLDPTVIAGGRFRGGPSNLRPGRGRFIVVEADEFDRAFLELESAIAVVTNIDAEHLDTYRDLEDLKDAFATFASAGPPDGAVVAGTESAHVAAIVPRLGRRCVTFGIEAACEVAATRVDVGPGATRFDLVLGGKPAGTCALRVPGAHNVRNALAAIAAAREAGIDPGTAVRALDGFVGMARRFEVLGERHGVLLVDDYAHHPAEMIATLAAARRVHPGRRIVVVFQPHLYSRTRDLATEMGAALLLADVAIVAPIYPAREQPLPGVTSALIGEAAAAAGHACVRAVERDADVLAVIGGAVRPGDVLLTMGAGDVTRFVGAVPN
jgi:UDP-N-acetylmuramate--alanine ligase